MTPDLGLPPWLLAGIGLGVVFAALIAAVFVAGERFAPRPDQSRGHRQRGEQLRREEIRYYLEAIGERFEEDATVEGYEVAFHLPEREVAVTFEPRPHLQLRDSQTHSILVEHEMPGVHLGNRLPFETPTVGPEAEGARNDAGHGPAFGARARSDTRNAGATSDGGRLTDREEIRASFAVLGLPPEATPEEVRSAYRDRVKEVHPDHGGDEDSFQRLQEAYATAKDHAE